MATRAHLVTWTVNRGRNDWDVPTDVSDQMSVESYNIDLERGSLGKKRRGSAAQTFTGDSFTGYNSIFRFVPKAGETSAEVFINSTDGTQKILRVAAGSAASNLTLKDNLTAAVSSWAVLNNKLYIAYDSAVNFLHVFSPDESTTTVRRVGFSTPAQIAAPTNTGSGSYAATVRYYRVQWRTKVSGTLVRQSLLGTSRSFTPSGSGTGAVVAQPAVPSEGETHWVVYGSSDDVLFYELSEIIIATTTYTDSAAPSSYSANDIAPDEGEDTPWPSVKFLLSTGERLVGFGVYETAAGSSLTPKNGRVYFSPVLDTSERDDDERVSNTIDFQGWIDVGRNSGAEDRALGGPMDNNVFVFQSKGIYMLVPTGQADTPYRRIVFHGDIGGLSQPSTFMGEDEAGRPALYWLDPVRGPYRYGANGLQWIGYDIQTLWATVNLAAGTAAAIGAYDPEQRACTWWLSTGANTTPNEAVKFFVREGMAGPNGEVHGGWTRLAEASSSAWKCMAVLPLTIGATMSRNLKVYTGSASALRRWHESGATQDAGVSFQAYVTSRTFSAGVLQMFKRLTRSIMQASVATATTITQTFTRNFGDETARTSTTLLTAAGSETRVVKKFEDAALADVKVFAVTLGDSAAANTPSWTLDEWIGAVETKDDL